MPQGVRSTLLLHADNSCILHQHRKVDEIEKQLNKDLEDVSDWFMDNKLSIHFDKDKTKSIFFASKRRSKNICKLNIRYNHTNIKQHSQFVCRGCVLHKTMSGEPMALKVIKKINGKLDFIFKKNKYLTKELRRMLCNALIQLHFDYACPAWYPNLDEKMKKKVQIMQNICIRFCLKLDKMHHVSEKEF